MLLAIGFLLAAAAAEVTPPVSPQTYVIGVEDLLAIHLWKEPEISRRVPVRPDGKISLPLVNDVQAAGLTPSRLAEVLTEAFSRHMTEAEVAVIVEQVHSKKFYVMGEVSRPGAYPLTGPTTVLQALTTAGGFREFANTKKIQVLRGVRQFRLHFDYGAVINGKKTHQNVLLEPGDTVVVP
jgi:polysaccharide export outer membrane protein